MHTSPMDKGFNFAEIGLETRDRRVYEALLERPQSSLRHIAANTGINRGSVYESVKQLVAIGLVGSIQTGKQQRYIAQDPAIIIELLKERQRQAQTAEVEAAQYIETLAKQPTEPADVPSFAVYYEGDEGIAAILRDVLKTMREASHKHYYVISSKQIRRYIYANFPNFTRQRIKEGVEVSVIAIGEGGESDPLSNRRWLRMDDGDGANCYTIVYANKTAFISMNEQNILSGIVIDNQGVTNVQREQFTRLWDTLGSTG
jgi:sugar-specific transcriptional regulator TrmB